MNFGANGGNAAVIEFHASSECLNVRPVRQNRWVSPGDLSTSSTRHRQMIDQIAPNVTYLLSKQPPQSNKRNDFRDFSEKKGNERVGMVSDADCERIDGAIHHDRPV